MALTEERKAELLAYCRIEPEEISEAEQSMLEGLYHAAVGYMSNAGISEPAVGTGRASQYALCVNYLVLDAWDRRAATITGTVVADNPAFRRLINQLKLSEPAPRNWHSPP